MCAARPARLGCVVLLCALLVAGSMSTASAQVWNVGSSSNWGTATNWNPNSVPDAAGATADLGYNIGATLTVTLDIDPTVGTLRLGDTNNTNAYVVGSAPGSGTLTFDNSGAGALLDHNSANSHSPNSSDRIDANVVLADDLTIDADRNIEFRGAWTGAGNSITLTNSNTSATRNSVRFYWNAANTSYYGTLSGVDTLNIDYGEARFDGIAGTLGLQLIGANTINLGTGTLQTDSRVFPRLYLVNTETTQTATLNVNGGWIVSDLGNYDNQVIWSGDVNFYGAAATNVFDVNDAGTADTHIVTGAIGGTGGFSKVNTGTLELTANNTISGNVYIQRAGVNGANLVSEGAIKLSGADGAFSAVNSVVISRDGSLYLDNSSVVNTNRFNDAGDLVLRGSGRLRMIGNASSATSETLGALVQETGSGKVNFDLDDSTPQLTSLTFSTYTRSAGSITQFQVLDDTYGAFGSALSGNARLYVTNPGSVIQYGGGTANGTTTQSVVVGAFGGVNNVSNHFMTFDSATPTELRPLAWTGDQATSEYFLSRDSLSTPHSFTVADLGTLNQNVNINYNADPTKDGDVDWYGVRPVNVMENVAMNSLRFGVDTPTSSTVSANTNEIGGALVLKPGAHIYLGDSTAANTGLSADTNGSGMILFGRDVDGTAPGHNLYVAGGVLDFGSREAIIVNESGNSALIRSEIRGTGGLTKAGAQNLYLDNSNSYSGDTNIAEGTLYVRDQNALGASTLVKIEGSGQFYLELGTNVVNTTTSATPPDLYVGVTDGSRNVLRSNSSNNTWGGNVIIDNVDNLGNWVYSAYVNTAARDTLNVNGNIYGNELANPINTDTSLNDARLVDTSGQDGSGGIINLNGQFRDNANGAISSVVTSSNENQVLRFQMQGSDELVVNARQQWNAAGRIYVTRGILRYEGDGNFYTPEALAAQVTSTGQSGGNGQTGFRMGNGSNNTTYNTVVILTKDGQVLNAPRIDIGGDGTNNFNGKGNDTLAGTNTSGTVTFGTGTDRILFGSTNSTYSHIRDLSVYAAGGGTVNLNYVLEDQDSDVHTSLTKLGRGTVNFNSGNLGTTARDGTVEQVTLAGGLLRLTGYGTATGRRFDSGAMIVFAGGGIEMDGVGSIANETENFTGTAVSGSALVPVGSTIVNPGGTDVIVTSTSGRTTTMNIGATTIALIRNTGGSLHFVQNDNGGSSVISFNGIGVTAGSSTTAFDSYLGGYATFTSTPGTVTDWAGLNSASRVGAFTGLTADTYGAGIHTDVVNATGVGTQAESLRFNTDAVNLNLGGGTFRVNGGGILSTSNVATSAGITGGSLTRTGGSDLVVHNYGTGAFALSANVVDDGANAVSVAFTGTGDTTVSGTNTYTGRTYFNGGKVTVSSESNLGTVPAAAVVDNLYFNGGTLHTTATMGLNANRGVTLGGNGGEVQVNDGTTLTVKGIIASQQLSLDSGYAANPALGRLDKSGSGTLVVDTMSGTAGAEVYANNTYNGLTEVKEGYLNWAPTTRIADNATVNAFGSNNAFLDGTIVRSGATLGLNALSTGYTGAGGTGQTGSIYLNEWFTFEGGSTLNVSEASNQNRGYYLRGVINLDDLGNGATVAGAVVFDVNRNSLSLNDDGGYLTGAGGIIKIGTGNLYIRENSPEWTGQLTVNEGTVRLYGAGYVAGTGTHPILLGHNLAAENAGEPNSGDTTVQLLVCDEGGYRDVVNISQDVIVRDDTGAGNQTKRIGAMYLADVDVVNYNGSLTLNDDVEFFYQDDARIAGDTASTSNYRNDTRSFGALTNSETVFINFTGDISGTKNITINVSQGGNGNATNGSINSPYDDLVERAIFGLNGDNSAWTGSLIMGNSTSDVDRNHIVSIGNPLGISAANDVTMRSNATLQTSGNDVVIGNLTATGTTETYIENASTAPGSITITQTTDASIDAVFRDGINFFVLQAGESDESLSVAKAGSAVLTLTSDNTYTGTTTVQQGTLKLVTASNSNVAYSSEIIVGDTYANNAAVLDVTGVSGTGGFQVGASQTLSGFGTVLGDLTVLGTHAPGASTGVQTVDGDYVNTGILEIEIGGTVPGNDPNGYDQVLITGTTDHDVTLGGTLELVFGGAAWSSPTDMLWIINNETDGALSDVFSNYPTNGTAVGSYDGRTWYVYYNADYDTASFVGGNDVLLTAVPEPSTLAMLAGLATLALLAHLRRRRST